jgi:hypothetical protein
MLCRCRGRLGGNARTGTHPARWRWRVIEVFESERTRAAFSKERFGPALEAVGFAGRRPQPQFWPVHNSMKEAASRGGPRGAVRIAQTA